MIYRRKRKKGQALVEFAIIVPLLFMFLFAIIDMGWMFMKYISVTQAVRESGRSASKGISRNTIRSRYGFSGNDVFTGESNAKRHRFDMVDLQISYNMNATGQTTEAVVTATVANDSLTPLSSVLALFGVSNVVPEYYRISSTFRLESDYTTVSPYTPPAPTATINPGLYPDITDSIGFTHKLVSVTENGDGTKTITMKITSDSDNGTHSLSHVVYGIPVNSEFLPSQNMVCSNGWPPGFIDPDPTTGLSGLKFDNATLGENGVVESATCQFVVEDTVTQFNIATKAGLDVGLISYDFSVGP